MKRLIVFITSLALFSVLAKAQDESYYYYGKEKTLRENPSVLHLQFRDTLSDEQYGEIGNFLRINTSVVGVFGDKHYVVQTNGRTSYQLQTLLNTQKNNIVYCSKEYFTSDSNRVWASREVLLKCKNDSVKIEEIMREARIPHADIRRNTFRPNDYIVTLSQDSAIFFAKKLFETGNFIYAEPNFCFYSRTDGYSQNTYFDSQWAINNDSVSVNVLDAWSITTGSNKIKTAVIDAGVDLSHEDLDANLVEGYNACSYHQFPWNIGNGSYEWVAETMGQCVQVSFPLRTII